MCAWVRVCVCVCVCVCAHVCMHACMFDAMCIILVQAHSTSSAGYNRLKHGIRGVKPYPSVPGGGVQQQRPHPGHTPRPGGPPPVGAVRSSYQPRQPWQ